MFQDEEEADFVEWLKGQAELEGGEEVKDMVSLIRMKKRAEDSDYPAHVCAFSVETEVLKRLLEQHAAGGEGALPPRLCA